MTADTGDPGHRPPSGPAAGPQWAAGEPLRQVDGTTCGPAVLVALAAITEGGWPEAVAGRFGAAQRRAHRQANRVWPRALGTTPFGMLAWLRRHAPAAGRYRARAWTARTAHRVAAAAALGRPVPLLVGSALAPRHWVLVTGAGDGGWRVYEPASGQVRTLDPALLAARSAAPVLGWPRPFGALLPDDGPPGPAPSGGGPLRS